MQPLGAVLQCAHPDAADFVACAKLWAHNRQRDQNENSSTQMLADMGERFLLFSQIEQTGRHLPASGGNLVELER